VGGLFATLAGPSGLKDDTRYGSLDLWRDLFGGAPVKSGVSVNALTALQTTTVLACVRRIAEALQEPCKIYRKNPATKERDEDPAHPLYEMLGAEPNSMQSGLEYRETVGLHVALTFNHYSYIGRVGGKVDELIPIPPAQVTPKWDRSSGALRYVIDWLDGNSTTLSQADVWHVRGPSWDGRVGMDAIRLLREAIGLAIATEETHARFHSNGAQPGGYISTDKDLTDAGVRARLKEQFQQTSGGVANKFKTIVLDNGMKWEPMTATGLDSQHLQLRQFQVEEICRGYCVMPIMVGYSGDKAPTFASAEQLFLAHREHTKRPWQRRIAESADRWLLSREERRAGLYVGFVDQDYVAADMKTQAEFFKIALGGAGNPGWYTLNQVRAFFEMPPVEGGDRPFAPTNAGPIGPDGVPMAAKTPAAPSPQQ
jgi:HK97 family phage portal protein